MALVKNITGEHRTVGGRLVLDGATLEVPAEDVYGFTCQEPNWTPADDEARKAHEAAVAALQPAAQPKGNASREEWAEYVVAAQLASEDDIKDMTRDQLRDTYGQED